MGGMQKFGFKSMKFIQGDLMMDESLPKADLFFSKDTFIHFPNHWISQFLNQTALACPPKYKYLMFVHDFRRRDAENPDIGKFGDFHGFNLKNPPFSVAVADTVFEWTSPHDARPHPRLVQVIDTS